MTSTATTTQDYLTSLPDDRKPAMTALRDTIAKNIPKGFEETMSYGMIGFVVPHSKYPAGYHCNPKLPLPFVNIGSQKNFIVMHHMGLYANPALLTWFTGEYPKHSKTKLDMGKGCVRFKKMDGIPYELIGELMKKMTPDDWIACCEKAFKRK